MEGPHRGRISPRPPSLAEQYSLALEIAESGHTDTNHGDYCRSTKYQAVIVESKTRAVMKRTTTTQATDAQT